MMKIRDESGQVLLLALGFLVFFSLVVGALVSFAGASVLASGQLREQRSVVYAADGALDAAIHAARDDKAIGAFGAVPCMHGSPFTHTASTADATVATVDCVSVADPIDLDRTVKFTASVGGVPKVVATVLYHDAGIASTTRSGVFILGWAYCGHDAGACT